MLATAYAGRRSPMEGVADRLRREGDEVDVVPIEVRPARPGRSPLVRLPGLLANWMTAARAATIRKHYDSIMVDTSPPLAFAPLVARARVRGERLELKHYDLFPENLAAFGIRAPRPALAAVAAATRWLARRADAHATLSPAMAATLGAALGPGVRIAVETLAPPPGVRPIPRAENPWLQERGLADRFVVMYAGNLGRAYDFAPVLAAAEALASLPIVFAFVGSGHQEDRIRGAGRRLGNVLLFPPESDARLAELLSAGDVHVVPLKPGADRVMWPHKIDAIRAAGRPVLAVGWGAGVEGVEVVAAARLAGELARRAASRPGRV
jgi:hypothetical protein